MDLSKRTESCLVIIGTKVFNRHSGIELGRFIREISSEERKAIHRGEKKLNPGESIICDRGVNKVYLIKPKTFEELPLEPKASERLLKSIFGKK